MHLETFLENIAGTRKQNDSLFFKQMTN